MKNATKGALAAAAAGSLLLGGAGSLAYWTDTETITGSGISSGELSLSQETGQVCGGWQISFNGGTATAFTAASDKIVPGDTLTKTCDYTINATGKNLVAELELAAPGFAATNALTTALSDVSAEYEIAGNPVSGSTVPVTSANDGDVLNVVVSVPFDSEVTGATAQNLSATLNNLTLTLDQTTS